MRAPLRLRRVWVRVLTRLAFWLHPDDPEACTVTGYCAVCSVTKSDRQWRRWSTGRTTP